MFVFAFSRATVPAGLSMVYNVNRRHVPVVELMLLVTRLLVRYVGSLET